MPLEAHTMSCTQCGAHAEYSLLQIFVPYVIGLQVASKQLCTLNPQLPQLVRASYVITCTLIVNLAGCAARMVIFRLNLCRRLIHDMQMWNTMLQL